jgi:hypothetical protein
MDTDWHRRRTEAESQLADARTTLGPMHPTVVGLSQKVEALSDPPRELSTLRDQEKGLVERLAASVPRTGTATGATPTGGGGGGGGGGRLSALPAAAVGMSSELRDLLARDDPPTAYARVKLQTTSQDYNETLVRLHLAKVELDIARAAFKNTYSVSRPAEYPTKPRKPNVPLLLIAGLVGAALLAFVGPGARDLLAGRFIEPWQVEMTLHLPVLGQLPPPSDSQQPPS